MAKMDAGFTNERWRRLPPPLPDDGAVSTSRSGCAPTCCGAHWTDDKEDVAKEEAEEIVGTIVIVVVVTTRAVSTIVIVVITKEGSRRMMGNERLKSENENEKEGSGCVTHKGEAASRTTPNHTGYVRAVRPLGRCDDRLCDRLCLVVVKEPIEDVKNSVKFSSDGEEAGGL